MRRETATLLKNGNLWRSGGAHEGFPEHRGYNHSNTFMEKYELGSRLAAGSKGVTYLAIERSTKQTVVAKKPNDVTDTRDFDFLKDKQHPNIARVFECFCTPDETFVIMEYYRGGDLFEALEDIGMPTCSWTAAVFKQVVHGVKYLYDEFRESHIDIKRENILLDRKPTCSEDIPKVVVADFGCAAAAGVLTHKTGGGDPRYRAPETFWNAPFGCSTDVWALGVLLFELLTGGLLIYINQKNVCGFRAFMSLEDGAVCKRFMRQLRAGHVVDVGIVNGDEAQDLLRGLLQVDSVQRLTLEGALSHSWFSVQCVESSVHCTSGGKPSTFCWHETATMPPVAHAVRWSPPVQHTKELQSAPKKYQNWGGC